MLQDNIDYTDRRDLLAAIQDGLLRQLVGNRIHSLVKSTNKPQISQKTINLVPPYLFFLVRTSSKDLC